ncbi:MarR family transcriptional regulator [Streptomyces sp. NBC_01340]|uniref:MarR family winged helix-turn-helix transcriptional regulator n=1 Tax=unclassified Streptomyces TaxID=2593676 RepID=UPI002255DE64|nr:MULTISPECIES: MarR family transcriptional regulator [unclassified Streptomyces]MCX4459341.1 MarR family transcriptional regulator [Streptomyces sp. NBC_01719]MCX4498698.1 MarR family transcriptional regulator [Streptomyces sp. NBC_01728]MCX4595399.1 MarR family transcriptional regulator [Streptomyces sp. NBC_01549]WSI43171.1 MarR family transcriptional regulator [Streptomyces sp. NBC_01340]
MASRSARQPQDLMRLLTRAERLAARRLEAVLDEDGCSLDAWRVLVLLSDGEGHHMTAVAEAAFLPPATLTKLVDQLVDQNLVHRRVDPLDRRRILAHLTPRGQTYWRRLDREVRARCPVLSDGEDELLRGLLERLVDTLDAAPAEPAL